MGSCYSCRSNGGPRTYTTVAMASVDDPKDKRKLPYSRGSSGSFGFKRRTPATMKSLSQQRTSELVSIYETKIANVGGHKHGDHLENTASRHSGADDNCNDILTMHNAASTKTVPSNRTSSAMGSPKRASGRLVSKGGQDHSSENLLVSVAKPRSTIDVENGNDKLTSGQVPQSSLAAKPSSKIPFKLKTQVSGLPRPQVPVLVSKVSTRTSDRDEVDGSTDMEAETQSLISVGPMQTSSDAIPNDDNFMFEGDSGIGTCSVSDRKTEGDTETLAEVDQIEGDSISISSITKERLPEKMNVTVVNMEKACKKEENLQKRSGEVQTKSVRQSGIARLKSVLPSKIAQPKTVLDSRGSPVLTEKVYKGPAHSQLQQPKSLKKKQPLPGEIIRSTNEKATPKSSPKRKVDARVVKGLKKEDSNNLKKEFGSNDEWKIITETRQKENITPDIEVEVKPIAISLYNKASNVPSTAEPKVAHKSPKIETVLPLSVFERKETRLKHAETSKKCDTSPQGDDSNDNSLNDMGPYSPPSEKDFFLIDDEIADQPGLIACQSLESSNYHDLSSNVKRNDVTLPISTLHSANLTDMSEEGGFPALAQSALSIKIPRRRVRSVDTLSPCSSLASDDLMLDFDKSEEGILDGSPNRPSSIILEDVGENDIQENNNINNNSRLHLSMRSPRQIKSQNAAGVFEELSQLMGSHSTEEPSSTSSNSVTKYYSVQKDCHGPSSASATSNCGCDASVYPQSKVTPSSSPSGSTFLARRSVGNLRPPKQMSIVEADDGSAKIDSSSYRYMCQDITNMKTMLLRLKRVLNENAVVDRADTLNPFEPPTWKNGLFLNLANNDPPDGVSVHRNSDCANESPTVADIEQENADLRRQVVFLQQQLEERERTIKLLQQQMTKYTSSQVCQERKEVSNAACQTERQKSLMGSSLSSSSEESAFGSTVSSPPIQQS